MFEESNNCNSEELVEQVWTDLNESVSRSAVRQTVIQLLAKYDDAVIRRYVPVLVRREARELLSIAVVTEIGATQGSLDTDLI